jgi:hypothetical protein
MDPDIGSAARMPVVPRPQRRAKQLLPPKPTLRAMPMALRVVVGGAGLLWWHDDRR